MAPKITSATISSPTAAGAAVRRHIQALVAAQAQVGSAPPKPLTPRGRIGALLVAAVHRMLFWFIPQVNEFHAAIIEALEAEARMLEDLAAAHDRAGTALLQLQEELALRRQDGKALPAVRNELESLKTVLIDFGRSLSDSRQEALQGEFEVRLNDAVRNEIQTYYREWNERHERLEATWWAECVKCRAQLDQLAAQKAERSHS